MLDQISTTTQPGRWFGKYRGFIRDNNDPERLGRCRLEVPAVLGSGPDHWSDWAAPCFPYGGNDDLGMFMVPPEGASIWAEFEGGDPQFPIWSGVWLAHSNPGEQPEESKRLCHNPLCHDCEDAKDHASNPIDAAEHTRFHGHPPYYCPRRLVLLKSETGHTIVCDDRDQEEFLKILDRAGQGIHLQAHVKRDVQVGNTKRRGTREAENGDQIDLATDVEDQRAKIEITDLSRQTLRFDAWHDHEKITIQSNDKTRSRWQRLVFDTTKGREKITISGLGGTQTIVVDGTEGRERIQIRDKAGSMIRMDGVSGILAVKAANKLLLG